MRRRWGPGSRPPRRTSPRPTPSGWSRNASSSSTTPRSVWTVPTGSACTASRSTRSTAPRPSTGPASSSGTPREHAADQRLPGDRADNAVDGDLGGLLEAAHPSLGLRAEDPVDLQRRRATAEVAERRLLLHALDRLALAAPAYRDDEGAPGLGTDDAVHRQVGRGLEGTHRGIGLGPEDAVDHDSLPALAEQVLQGPHGMFGIALADQGPGLDVRRCCHGCLLRRK